MVLFCKQRNTETRIEKKPSYRSNSTSWDPITTWYWKLDFHHHYSSLPGKPLYNFVGRIQRYWDGHYWTILSHRQVWKVRFTEETWDVSGPSQLTKARTAFFWGKPGFSSQRQRLIWDALELERKRSNQLQGWGLAEKLAVRPMRAQVTEGKEWYRRVWNPDMQSIGQINLSVGPTGGGGVVNQRTWSICLDSVEFLAMVMGLTFCVNLFPVIMLVGTGVQIRSDQFSSV